MSLHAHLSPGVRAALERQARINRASAAAISLLALVLIGLILALITLFPQAPDDDGPVCIYNPPEIVEPPDNPEPRPIIERKPVPPSQRPLPNIAVNMAAPTAIPIPDQLADEPSVEFGAGADFGNGWITGGPGGTGPPGIPRSAGKRCSLQDRLKRLEEMGGTPACETAVVAALDWLQARQQDDGSWPGGGKPVAMTGLALLAYLGHCETPASGHYSDTVFQAITYLINQGLRHDGRLTSNPADKHWPYEHAIATYALAEAFVFCKELDFTIPGLEESTRIGGQFIIDHQHPASGGWDYGYDRSGPRGGDLSVTAWQIQALRACSHTGLDFPGWKTALRKAGDYVEALQGDSGGFGYTSKPGGNHAYATLTGAGTLSLQITGSKSSAEVRKAVRYLRERSHFDYHGAESDLYGHYYEAQVMMNRGGSDWNWYNRLFLDQLLSTQLANGSWPPPGTRAGGKLRAVAPHYTSNELYRVCLNTLMLEVYYRYLPSSE